MIANARRQVHTSSWTLSVPVLLCACQLLLLVCGCATFNPALPNDEDVTEKLQQRKRETSRRLDQSRDFAEFQAALDSWQRNDVRGCEENLTRLLERNADHCDGRLLMADVCLAQERPQEALVHARHAVVAHPDNAEAKYALALLLDSLGQSRPALAYYEQAAVAEPENEIFVVGYRSAMRAAKATTAQGTIIDGMPQGLAVSSDSARQVGFRAEVSGGSGSVGFNEEISVGAAGDYVARATDALKRGAVEESREYFRQAVLANPNNPDIPVNSAVSALRLNQPALAVEVLQPAAEIFERSARIHRVLGVAHYRAGNYESSQVALQQALSLDKSSALTYFLMGCTLAKLGQTELADAHFKKAQAMRSTEAVRW